MSRTLGQRYAFHDLPLQVIAEQFFAVLLLRIVKLAQIEHVALAQHLVIEIPHRRRAPAILIDLVERLGAAAVSLI